MRGPDKDAVVVRGQEGLTVEVTPEAAPEKSPLRWPLIRGVYNFFGSNIVGSESADAVGRPLSRGGRGGESV